MDLQLSFIISFSWFSLLCAWKSLKHGYHCEESPTFRLKNLASVPTHDHPHGAPAATATPPAAPATPPASLLWTWCAAIVPVAKGSVVNLSFVEIWSSIKQSDFGHNLLSSDQFDGTWSQSSVVKHQYVWWRMITCSKGRLRMFIEQKTNTMDSKCDFRNTLAQQHEWKRSKNVCRFVSILALIVTEFRWVI